MLKIIKDNAKSLRKKSLEVQIPLSPDDEKLLFSLLAYIKLSQDKEYAEKHHIREGIGLAAPQVGHNKRMLAVYYPKDENNYQELALVNPKIIANSVKLAYLKSGEGCLSVDSDYPGYVYRSYKITVRAYDAMKKEVVELTFKDYDAIVIQHEIDHLDGKLFYDRIDKKEPFIKKDNSVEI